MDSCVQIVRLMCSEVHTSLRLGDDEERKLVAKSMNSHWREKLLNMSLDARTANRHRWARRKS